MQDSSVTAETDLNKLEVNVHVFGFGTASSIATKSKLGVFSKVVERNDIQGVRARGIQKYMLLF